MELPERKFLYFCASRDAWLISPVYGPTMPGHPMEDLFQVAIAGGGRGIAMSTKNQEIWQEFDPTGLFLERKLTIFVDQGDGVPEVYTPG